MYGSHKRFLKCALFKNNQVCVPDCAFGFAQPIGDVAVFQNNPKLLNLDASGTKVHGKDREGVKAKKREMQA